MSKPATVGMRAATNVAFLDTTIGSHGQTMEPRLTRQRPCYNTAREVGQTTAGHGSDAAQ